MNTYETGRNTLLICLFLTLYSWSTYGQDSLFTPIDAGIPGYAYPSFEWGDIDGDGDLDFVISGALDTDNDFSADRSKIDIYMNHDGEFKLDSTDIYGLHLGVVSLKDLDHDGDLDLIATGQNYVDILSYPLTICTNQNGAFTATQHLSGAIYSSMSWGDYDLDGDEDLLMTGAVQTPDGAGVTTVLFKNNNGRLDSTGIALPGVQNGDAKFVDVDKDGDLDILLMGYDGNSEYLLQYYTNTEGEFTLAQDMSGIYLGALDYADFDGDGDLDFAVMGDDINDDYAALVYINNEGTFEVFDTLVGVDNSSGYSPIDWGDFDNDGKPDLLMAGSDEDYEDVTFLYKNMGDHFARVYEGITNVGGSAAAGFADFDNDLDLDAMVSGFLSDADFNYYNVVSLNENRVQLVNQRPTVSNITGDYDTGNETLTLNWDLGQDDTTPPAGLSYILKVIDADTDTTILEYPVYNTFHAVRIAQRNFRCEIRAVDAAHAVSDPASVLVGSSSVVDLNIASNMAIYPNPARHAISVKNYETIDVNWSIKNPYGSTILQGSSTLEDIAVETLVPGHYILEIINGEQITSIVFIKI